jgi:hypothetical protein
MTAPGFHHDHVGAPSAADLDEADMSRCEKCHVICDAAETVDTGLCGDCQPRDTQTREEIERSAGGY